MSVRRMSQTDGGSYHGPKSKSSHVGAEQLQSREVRWSSALPSGTEALHMVSVSGDVRQVTSSND